MKHKLRYSILLVFLLINACSDKNKFIRIKGSDSVLPLTQKEVEIYAAQFPDARTITVTGGGSGVGIASLLDGTTDIAMSSRALKVNEKLKMQEQKQEAVEFIVAYDALAIAVHPKNPVTKLTREQIEGIFIGKITNWKEVGGNDASIVAYSRESSSGTYEFFKSKALDNREFGAKILLLASNGAVIQAISQNPNAIGYIGIAYITANIKPLQISFDGGKNYVAPSLKTAQDKSYPIIRPLYYYYLKNKTTKIQPYLDFILSAEGQKIVRDIGYIPIKK